MKRAIGLFLAAMLLLSLLPVSGMADQPAVVGQFVVLDDGTPIWVTRHGTGDKAVVFLPGMAVMSPTIEFKPMAEKLVAANPDVSAYIFEYPGLGFSPETKNPRTIDNIVGEFDETMTKLGLTGFTMVVHSISGLYGLYYLNKYPGKVNGFIGIDTSCAKQVELFDYALMEPYFAEVYAQAALPVDQLTAEANPDFFVYCTDYEYTKEDQALFVQLARNAYNPTTIDEWKHMNENFGAAKGMVFPPEMPVVLFVADVTAEFLPEWPDLHKELISGDKHQMITFDGPHELYRRHLNDMMPTIEALIAGI